MTLSAFKRGRSGGGRHGSTLIEMVVSLMVLFYLVMGGVEFGWYMYAKHVVQSAARDAARSGIIGTATHAQAQSAVTQAMTAAGFQSIGYTTTYERVTVNGSGVVTLTTTNDVATVTRGEGLRVTVSAPFSAFRVRPLGVIAATKVVPGVCTMVKE